MTKISLLLVASCAVAFPQPAPGPKPTLSVREIPAGPLGSVMQIDINTVVSIPRDFAQREAGRLDNYHLYVVLNPDEPEVRVQDITADYFETVDSGFPNSIRIKLKANKHLNAKLTYILTLSNFDPPTNPRLSLRFKPEGTLVIANMTKQASQIMVNSPVPLSVSDGADINVERKVIHLTRGPNYVETTQRVPAQVISAGAGNDLIVKLGRPLPEGKEHQLTITAPAADGTGVALIANGKIKPAGAPVKEEDALFNLSFGGNAAVHQTGVFTLAGKLAPLHPLFLRGSTLHWDPSVILDVGLHTTKTANSIIFDLPFRFVLPLSNAGSSGGSNLPAYAAWAHSGPLSIGALEFAIGPRFEVDRNFGRLDAVLENRMDIRFIKLQRNISTLTALILKDLPKDKTDLLEPIRWGFELTPYLGTDEGRYISQTVTDSKRTNTITVPGSAIFRAFGGIRGKIEYLRFSITYDERAYWLGAREIVAYKTSTGVGMRTVRGWQAHSKVTIDYSLDHGKHYALTAAYEDGRLPPNLEYLDKVTFGFKFLF